MSGGATESGGWWSGLISTVASASTSIINVYKEELSEFSQIIQEDTKQVVSKQLQTIKDETSVVLNLLGTQESKPDEHRLETQKIDIDPRQLYIADPADLDDYKKWLQTFDIKEKTEEISQLLSSNDTLKNVHKDLVPASVSYSDFWRRYYYKLQKEHRRAALLERAQHQNEEEIGWDDDESELNPTSAAEPNAPLPAPATSSSPSSPSPLAPPSPPAPPSPVLPLPESTPAAPATLPEGPHAIETPERDNRPEEEWADWE
eukprot:TRINITY_DN440_c0_g2_i1.p1 TRINITY_DN440_c0_g2~~TRINITY_DN440_c0_g2_i1.p1  ORF type:complete len:261 (-),score=77.21 TRINITY_DN440_c0_g2_i1:373-1155(-)